MGEKLTTDYVDIFKKELENIDKLEQTPRLIKDQAVQALDKVMEDSGLSRTDKKILENAKQSLKNISEGSIKNNFKIIYSQMCVLAVSSLEATLKKYFENSLNVLSNINRKNKKLKQLKISFEELVENGLKFGGKFGGLVIEKDKPNFQDLQSIKNIFKNYISKDIELEEEDERKICFYLETRHVLVHKGGSIDEKFLKATRSLNANIKNYQKGDHVEIDESDWENIKEVMKKLVKQATNRK